MAAKINFPLSPDVLEIRRVVGDAENLHNKVDSVKTKTDNLPADTASVLSTITGHVDGLESDVIAIKAKTDNLPADTTTVLSTIDTVVDAIKTKTDNLPADTATVLTNIDTEIGLIQTDVTAIKTKTDNLPTDTATVLTNTNTVVDTINSNVGTATSLGGGIATISGMLQSLGGSGFTATDSLKDVKAAILAVQNNTSFTASVVPIMEKPETGSNDYQALTNVYDGNGALIDPDFSKVFVKVQNPTGISLNENLFNSAGQTSAATKIAFYTITEPTVTPTMGAVYEDVNNTSLTVIGMAGSTSFIVEWSGVTTPVTGTLTKISGNGDATLTASAVDTTYVQLKKDALGQYSIFYNVNSSATKQNVTFRFGYFLNGVWRGYDRASAIQDYEATASVAGEVWNQLTSAHTEVGSYGLLISHIAGTNFATATDSLHALKGRLDTVDTSLSTIEGYVDALETDVSTIKTKTDNLPADTATVLSTIDTAVNNITSNIGTPVAIDGGTATIVGMLQKLFDNGSGFDAATDSLAALREALDAKPTYPSSFAGSKTTTALAQSASETLEFSTTEGLTTNNATLLQLKATVTGATSNFTLQIYEKTGSANLIYEVQNIDATGLNLALPNVIFRNADNTPTNKIYVKITNVTDVGSSTITVELRGLLNAN